TTIFRLHEVVQIRVLLTRADLGRICQERLRANGKGMVLPGCASSMQSRSPRTGFRIGSSSSLTRSNSPLILWRSQRIFFQTLLLLTPPTRKSYPHLSDFHWL